MEIITWNLQHMKSRKSWRFAIEKINPEICIFQESFHPLTYLNYKEFNNIRNNYIWEPTENGWGTTIITKNKEIERKIFSHSFKGRIVVGCCEYKEVGQLTIIGLHVPIIKGYSRFNLLQMFDEIHPFTLKGKCIIGGDLNFGECFDRNGKTECRDILNSILEKNKLINCYKKFNLKEKQTFRPTRKSKSQIHIDYIFVSEDLSEKIVDCFIIENDEIKSLSDHNPVVAIMKE